MAAHPVGAAAEAAARIIGGIVVPSDGTVPVTNVPTNILPNNPERAVLYMLNLSASTLYAAPTSRVQTNSGIALPPNGGSMSLVVTEDFQLVSSTWWVIGPAGPNDIYFLEMVRETAFSEVT